MERKQHNLRLILGVAYLAEKYIIIHSELNVAIFKATCVFPSLQDNMQLAQ